MMRFCYILLIFPFFATAQNQTNYWYFGNKVGLNFNYSPPRVWNNSQMQVFGGGVTVSDSTGKLLFYTDGKTVWNNRHWIIGQGFKTNTSANSIRVLNHPSNKSLYHLFSLNSPLQGSKYNLYHSTVEIINSKVKVTNKNKLTKAKHFSSGITTLLHSNQKDLWIVVHDGNQTFYAYLLTTQGIQPNPIKSKVSQVAQLEYGKTQYLYYLKSSTQSNKVAMLYFTNQIQLFDFDNATGKLSKNIILRGDIKANFQSIEFSPSGQKLYASAIGAESKYNANLLYQFDLLNQGKPTRKLINIPNTPPYILGLQLAKNGKIYVAQFNHTHLGVINHPEKPGKLCDYIHEGIHLKGRSSRTGLPAFPAHYFRPSKQIAVGKPFVRNIEFASAQATIQPKYYKLLDDIVVFLKTHPKTRISITGHTDNVGFAKSNLILSKKRAEAVANYFAKKGIEKERISTKGEGQTTPIASNTNAIGRKKNRRIEFFIK